MVARTRHAALALAAASALVLGGAAAPALAGDPADDCNLITLTDFTTVTTTGAWWSEVCLNDASIGEGDTANKADAFDTVGDLYALGSTDVHLVAPDSAITSGYSGATFSSSWIDAGVDVGGGDVFDVAVDLTLAGTYAQWTISSVDAGTTTPATLSLAWEGDLGSDSDTTWLVSGDQMLSYGDPNDPILLWEVDADTVVYDVIDGASGIVIEAEGAEISITVAMVDFGCPAAMDAPGALTYAQSIAGTFTSTFGASLQVPGTQDCLTVAPITVAPGAAVDHAASIAYTGIDFEAGGNGSFWIPDVAVDATLNVVIEDVQQPGVTPTFVLVGTAPTVPGTYWVTLYVWNLDGEYASGHLQVIVEAPPAPQLAATGSSMPWAIGGAAVLALLAGVGALSIRRVSD